MAVVTQRIAPNESFGNPLAGERVEEAARQPSRRTTNGVPLGDHHILARGDTKHALSNRTAKWRELGIEDKFIPVDNGPEALEERKAYLHHSRTSIIGIDPGRVHTWTCWTRASDQSGKLSARPSTLKSSTLQQSIESRQRVMAEERRTFPVHLNALTARIPEIVTPLADEGDRDVDKRVARKILEIVLRTKSSCGNARYTYRQVRQRRRARGQR